MARLSGSEKSEVKRESELNNESTDTSISLSQVAARGMCFEQVRIKGTAFQLERATAAEEPSYL